jgi:serine/threonine protein kinase/tetratricopeptide (TPR) repeat protein
MSTQTTCDEDLVRRLPLPLAKIYRRAHSARAKSALELHQAAYYLWEASLKLLGSTAIVAYAERGEHDPELSECLKKISRPMLGSWWEFVRRLLPVLADGGDPGFAQARDLVLGRERNDLPKSAALGAALLEARGLATGSRSKVRLSELFDRLVKYRNDNPGHGALGMGSDENYNRMGLALLSAGGELLGQLDVLAGRRLVYVKEVRRRPNGGWLVERFELTGESPTQIESLELPERDTGRLPHPGKIYLESPDAPERPPSVMLHPLAVYDPDEGMVLFLNARRKNRTEYLSYTSGRHFDRDDLGEERRTLLARILDTHLDEAEYAALEAESKAEQERDDPAPADALTEASLRSLGEFELLSELGRGNMGVVYRAWQPSLGRQVALKRSLRTGDPKTEQRFQREIRAMGKVDHPNLVKVFSSGFEGEHWYYAMELVEGATLSAVCDALQTRSSTAADIDLATWRDSLSTACEAARQAEKSVGDGALPVPAPHPSTNRDTGLAPTLDRDYIRHVIELLRQSAQAAHVLHGVGVIHRDIKPGNIMVSSDGTHAILIDLGLAQLADAIDGKLTRTRQFLGTLRYASPEQVLSVGSLDHRSDIYSLGATLWELLTLRPLFGATDATPTPELMQTITTREPERVRRHNPKVSRDLESIVHKCLEKDPSRRYATASDLADDLGRYLKGEVVLAQPPSFGYQASKFVRRHKAPLATAAAVLLLVVTGTVAAFLNIDSERRKTLEANTLLKGQQRETEKALAKSEANFKLAEQRFGEKRAALDDMLHRFSDERLKVMPGAQEVRQVFLKEGLDLYKQILRERQDDPAVKAQLAECYGELGTLQNEIGSKEESLTNLQGSVDYRRQLATASPDDPAAAAALGDALFKLAQFFWEQQRTAEVLTVAQESVDVFNRLLSRYPDEPVYKAGLGRSLSRLVSARPDKANEEKDLKRARAMLSDAAKAMPNDAEILTALARVLNNLAATLPDERLYSEEGLALFDESRRWAEKALQVNPAHSLAGNIYVSAVRNKAAKLGRMGHKEECVRLLEETIADTKVFIRKNPAVVRAFTSLTILQDLMATTYRQQRRYDDAVRVWEELVSLHEGLAQRLPGNPAFPYERVNALTQIGEIETSRGQTLKGAAALDRAFVGAPETVRAHPRDANLLWAVMLAYARRGALDKEAGRYTDAVRVYTEGMTLFEKTGMRPGVPHVGALSQYIACATDAVTCLHELKDRPAAIRLAERAMPLGEALTDPDHRYNWTLLLADLAQDYKAAGEKEKAIGAFKKQLKEVTDLLAHAPGQVFTDRANLVGINMSLAELYKAVGDLDGEYEALRGKLAHSGYVDGVDYAPVLAATTERNQASMNKLREAVEQSKKYGMKRFTVPTDFNGVNYPMNIYVANNYKFTEDQLRWVEKVRGGKVSKEVEESFQRLAKNAKDKNVSFSDLCVYTLGGASLDENLKEPISKAREGLERLKARLNSAPEADRPDLRREVTRESVRLANLYCDGKSPMSINSAGETLKEAQEAIPLDDQGAVKNTEDRGVQSEALYVRGRIELAYDQTERAYATLLESLLLAREYARPKVPSDGRRELALGRACEKLNRVLEAAFWYWGAADLGHGEAIKPLAKLLQADQRVADALPPAFTLVISRIVKSPADTKSDGFAEHLTEAWTRYRNSSASRAGGDLQVSSPGLAEQHRVIALHYSKQGNRPLALKYFLEELAERRRAAMASPKDITLQSAVGQALVDAGVQYAETGQQAQGVKMVNEAADAHSEAAAFVLADWYERGRFVGTEPDKANRLRAQGHAWRGGRAFAREELSVALPDLKLAAELFKTDAEAYERLGACQFALGRWSEAVASYSLALELSPDSPRAPGTILKLFEVMIIAGKPSDVRPFAAKLDARKWMPKPTDQSLDSFLAVSYGLRTVAGWIAGQDVSSEEKKVHEILGRPNFWVNGWNSESLSAGLRSAKIPPDRREAVETLLKDIESPHLTQASPYYPLQSGTLWSFDGDAISGMAVNGPYRLGDVARYELSAVTDPTSGGKRSKDRIGYISVERDGIYQHSMGSINLKAPFKILSLPPKVSDTWESQLADADEAPKQGKGRGKVLRFEEVTVPAGTYKRAIVVETAVEIGDLRREDTTWYAEGVGPVRIVSKSGDKVSEQKLARVTIDHSTAELDSLKRSISLLSFILENGEPFWMFVAVKPEKYAKFQAAYRDGKLDIHNLDPFGEFIVCGDGKQPPENVIAKVAEMYQTDAKTLMNSLKTQPAPKR